MRERKNESGFEWAEKCVGSGRCWGGETLIFQ